MAALPPTVVRVEPDVHRACRWIGRWVDALVINNAEGRYTVPAGVQEVTIRFSGGVLYMKNDGGPMTGASAAVPGGAVPDGSGSELVSNTDPPVRVTPGQVISFFNSSACVITLTGRGMD